MATGQNINTYFQGTWHKGNPAIINAADHIIDLGPGAGSMGGTIVGQGNLNKIVKTESLTAKYLAGKMELPVHESRKKIINKITLTG